MKMDKRATAALARISASEPHFLEWLQDRLVQHQNQMVTQMDEVAVRWAQGRAQEVKDIIRDFEDAAKT